MSTADTEIPKTNEMVADNENTHIINSIIQTQTELKKYYDELNKKEKEGEELAKEITEKEKNGDVPNNIDTIKANTIETRKYYLREYINVLKKSLEEKIKNQNFQILSADEKEKTLNCCSTSSTANL